MNKHKEFTPGGITIQNNERADAHTMGVEEDDERQEERLGTQRRERRKRTQESLKCMLPSLELKNEQVLKFEHSIESASCMNIT